MPTERRRRRRGLSLRARITLGAGVIVAALLVAVSIAQVRIATNSAMQQLDEILSDEAEAIGKALGLQREVPILFDDDRAMVALDGDGAIVASEVDEGDDPADLAALDVVTADDRGVDRRYSDQEHRIVAEPYRTPAGDTGMVRLAEPIDEFDDTVVSLLHALMWTAPLTLALLLLIVWIVVGRALRPVDVMRAEVDQLAFEQLDRRLKVPATDDEIARLATTMNTMLERLAVSARRHQQFVADASHELRTPLARMRAELEADAQAEVQPRAAARQSQLEEVIELQSLLEDLLLLARRDAGAGAGPATSVDLDDLVLDEARAMRNDRVRIDVSHVSGAQIRGVSKDLHRAIRNLMENALQHARTTVAIRLGEEDGGVVLRVDDDGDGVPPDQRLEVFERFARLDAARHRSAGGAGLGLAIVHEVVAGHGGTVRIEDSPLGGARFTVELPAGQPAPA